MINNEPIESPPINRIQSFDPPSLVPSEVTSIDRLNLRRTIIDNYLYPSIIKDFEKCLAERSKYNKINKVFIILKYLCLITSPMLSFSIILSNVSALNFCTCILSSGGIAFDKLSSHCVQVINDNNKKMNEMLIKLNINYTFDLDKDEKKDDSK